MDSARRAPAVPLPWQPAPPPPPLPPLLLLLSALLLLCSSSLCGLARAESTQLESRSFEEFPAKDLDASHEKELLDALQSVLEKLQNKRMPSWEKKYGQLPICDAGEWCAVRKGARIGKLCDCTRGTSCNSFLLKCL
uniref:Cocaine- and amphetamine-regulated transcript protein n=1 Tax=Petromyzon marinus TaxID=7757 RepID=A0AAJ7XEX9_PETMA|nr:cocaine- and amphetamine-regulated transcript protein-like [Petromyzon marinus]